MNKQVLRKKETWRDVESHAGLYMVSNMGRVCSLHGVNFDKKRILRGGGSKYPVVTLYRDGERTYRHVHRVVMDAFVGPPEYGYCVNHKDGNVKNNRLSNLEYVTRSQNMKHAYSNGLQIPRRGEDHHLTNIDGNDVLEIRSRYRSEHAHGIKTRLAKEFGVSVATIANIVNRRTWGHV